MARKKPTHAKERLVTPRVESLGGESHAKTLITRRGFLYGAIGVGAVLAVAGGIGITMSLTGSDNDEDSFETLEVPSSAVTELEEMNEMAPASDHMALIGDFALPYGTLVWANSENIAACLIPTEEVSKPLTRVALLTLGNGVYATVLESALGSTDGFDIYDVRANDNGMIWTEVNIFKNIWRVLTAPLVGGVMGTAIIVDEGDSEWETPTLGVAGRSAFWQVLPSLSGTKTTEESVLKRATFGQSEGQVVYSSVGRMSTPPYSLADSVVITPRTNSSAVHHQLTLIDADNASVLDKMVLPQSMKPLEAGYGPTGFTFSFEGIYNYGDGISNLGTYTPKQSHGTEDYNGLEWFHFTRTPTASPAWCGRYFIVKSTTAVCGIEFDSNSYFALDVESGSDDYGDYLASSGINNIVVTYANVDTKTLEGEEIRHCQVRVYTPIT